MNLQETASVPGGILVVDDTPNNLRLLAQLLSEQGYKVRVADDGPRAIESVQANPPDLILLDIIMPGMDGYEVCRQLKAEEATRDIPVIFISALDATQDIVTALTAGGVDHITKPFQPEEVLARVKTHLALRNARRNLQEKTKQLERVNAELEHEIAERKLELLARVQAELKLQEYARTLEARNAELDAFAHTVAHDLKNPLTGLIGYSQMLELGYADMSAEEIEPCLHSITLSAKAMSEIIDELLLLSSVRRMEQVETRPVNMQSVVEAAYKRLSAAIAESQAQVKLPDAWPIIVSYGPWITEVWTNYLSNAIKYGGTPPQIELGFDETDQTGNRTLARVRFWVRDNGNGLTPDEQTNLFAEFSRGQETRAAGYGLGLSIVRRIVERLNGEVGVESEVGRGSKFWFTLPRRLRTAAADTGGTSPEFKT